MCNVPGGVGVTPPFTETNRHPSCAGVCVCFFGCLFFAYFSIISVNLDDEFQLKCLKRLNRSRRTCAGWPQTGAPCSAQVLDTFAEGRVLIGYRSDSKEIRDGSAASLWPQLWPRIHPDCLYSSAQALPDQQIESLTQGLSQDWIAAHNQNTHSSFVTQKNFSQKWPHSFFRLLLLILRRFHVQYEKFSHWKCVFFLFRIFLCNFSPAFIFVSHTLKKKNTSKYFHTRRSFLRR